MAAPDDPHLIQVETHFQKMARRSGGISRQQALENAQVAIDSIKLGFSDWLDGEIQSLTAAITKGKSAAAGSIDWAESAVAHARQIRDVGTTMGYDLATFIAGNLCEICESIVAGAPPRIDLIDCHIGALALAKQPQYRHLRPDQVPELSTGLRRIVDVAGGSDEPGK